MVLISSLTKEIKFVLAASYVLFAVVSDAAPTTIPLIERSSASSSNVTHVNGTLTDADVTLPPLIPKRVIPATKVPHDYDVESEYVTKNTQWYNEHGGNYTLTKRDEIETVGNFTMDLPPNPPHFPAYPKDDLVIKANAKKIEELAKYAGIAATAYCRDVVPANNWKCEQCLKQVPDGKLIKTFTSFVSDTNGFVLRSDKEKVIYLVFRGTNSIRSSIADIQFDFTTYPNVKGAKVHRGFLNSYNEVVRSFFPDIQDQITAFPSYKVIVTGHSLGAAQALLAGMDLYQRDSRLSAKNLAIYTVGMPRTGNAAFAYYVDSTGIPLSRSVNERDIVPHVPPQAFGYLHPGVEAWIRSSGSVQICTDSVESDLCSNSIVPFTTISDHLSYYDINQGLCL
ncbi:uncharacterized protein ATC70_012702 [Mucor velutinosus]|uniref:Fungal lipase-type domain-containing protein n=1 Tax=Mucor velutinosus TaxID=708070 RepID=A0AAN7D610_9FUNG|nr:hypothetical protein ATC70_012702 [Mucor velutinosus]